MVVRQEYCVMRQEISEIDAFIMMHPDLPNKELYATKRMVQITEEGLEEENFKHAGQRQPL